jgi:hypothetical protein
MTRPLAVSLAVLLASPLAACATPRGGDGQPAPNAAPAAAAEEPKWEPWPPPEASRPADPDPAPSGEMIRLLPKEGGWKLTEWIEQVAKATGRPILYDETNATFKQAKIDFTGTVAMRQSDLFAFAQAALSYKKLVLVPVGPKLADGQQAWFVMDQADPNLKSRPVFLDENEVLDYADRDGLYVVTTLRLRDTVEPTRARNALSPLSTATAGIGRIQDMGGRFLIVGDFAPVVAAMKRLLDRINAGSEPYASRPAPAPAAPAAPKAEK